MMNSLSMLMPRNALSAQQTFQPWGMGWWGR